MRLFTILRDNGSLILDPKDRYYLVLRTLGILTYYKKNYSILEFGSCNTDDLIKTDNGFIFKSKKLPSVINFHTISEQSLRLFACDCAQRVLFLFENEYPNNDKPRKAIETARKYARGLATGRELEKASAAAYVAWNVNKSVAGRAAYAAQSTAYVAQSGGGDGARDTAWTAWSTFPNTTRNTERDWQEKRLEDYIDGKIEI